MPVRLAADDAVLKGWDQRHTRRRSKGGVTVFRSDVGVPTPVEEKHAAGARGVPALPWKEALRQAPPVQGPMSARVAVMRQPSRPGTAGSAATGSPAPAAVAPAVDTSIKYKPLPPVPPPFTGRHHPADGPALAAADAMSVAPRSAALRHGSRAATRAGAGENVTQSTDAPHWVFFPAPTATRSATTATAGGSHVSRKRLAAHAAAVCGLDTGTVPAEALLRVRHASTKELAPCVHGSRHCWTPRVARASARRLPETAGVAIALAVAHSPEAWLAFVGRVAADMGVPRCRQQTVLAAHIGGPAPVLVCGRPDSRSTPTPGSATTSVFAFVRRRCRHGPPPRVTRCAGDVKPVQYSSPLPTTEQMVAAEAKVAAAKEAANIANVAAASASTVVLHHAQPIRAIKAPPVPLTPRLKDVLEQSAAPVSIDAQLAAGIASVLLAGQTPRKDVCAATAATFDDAADAMGMVQSNMLAVMLRHGWEQTVSVSQDVPDAEWG